MASDISNLVRRLKAQKFDVRYTRNGHLRVSKGGASLTMPSTPSDHRSLKNTESDLKKMGYRKK